VYRGGSAAPTSPTQEPHQPLQALGHGGLVDDGVTQVDRFRLVAGDLHGDGAGVVGHRYLISPRSVHSGAVRGRPQAQERPAHARPGQGRDTEEVPGPKSPLCLHASLPGVEQQHCLPADGGRAVSVEEAPETGLNVRRPRTTI